MYSIKYVLYSKEDFNIRTTLLSYIEAIKLQSKLNDAFGFNKFLIGEIHKDRNKIITVKPNKLINNKNIKKGDYLQ